jgi:hypothetical protein
LGVIHFSRVFEDDGGFTQCRILMRNDVVDASIEAETGKGRDADADAKAELAGLGQANSLGLVWSS